MSMFLGLALVLAAAVLQGSFILPMTFTRGWKWEHSWGLFSILGMLILNWMIGFALLPHLFRAIASTPRGDIAALLGFGACWGVGAILFGKGMEKLGMAVGYPVIMGLILGLGALIPLAQRGLAEFTARSGLLLLSGTAVVLTGIVLCSRASARKNATMLTVHSSATGAGMIVAVSAGVLSCLPNVGLNNATSLTLSAIRLGASPAVASNAAWVVQFTAGFIVNFIYCAFLVMRRRNVSELKFDLLRNVSLIALMAILWIGSFYLYGIGAFKMGSWGAVVGWPLFISLAIIVGNLWGLWRGEWKTAQPAARSQLNLGLIVILVAVILFGFGGGVR